MPKTILIGAPIDTGQKRAGCLMGPAAYRVAGIAHEIAAEGACRSRIGATSPCPTCAT
jgi:arginase